jgi:hypothetical protein
MFSSKRLVCPRIFSQKKRHLEIGEYRLTPVVVPIVMFAPVVMVVPIVMITPIVMIVTVVMIVPVMTEITFVTVIPVMIVLDPSVASLPIACKIPLSVMVGRNPTRVFVRWPSPISWMPPIVMFDGIPIAFHPQEIRRWPGGHHGHHAWWRRSADLDSNRDLPVSRRGAES